jgi:GTPase SAR1 family protein
MTEIEGKTQHLYKVLVIGDYAVGKTSIIKRYCEGYFTPNYKLTIGVDFAVKVVEWDEKTTVSLQVYPDTEIISFFLFRSQHLFRLLVFVALILNLIFFISIKQFSAFLSRIPS